MKSVAREIHRDSEYLVSDTHDGANSATTLQNMDIDFRVCGVTVGVYIENTDSGENSLVASVSEHHVTTDDNISWNNGHTFEIYKTSAKNSLISSVWTDVSRGFKVQDESELNQHGWFHEDWDLDDKGRKRVFGPNQPERN